MSLISLFAAGAQSLTQNIPHVEASQATLDGILNAVYIVAGGIAVAFIVVGGIRYIISAGESSKVSQAKGTIVSAITGLVIVLMAFVITNFVLGAVKVTSWTSLRDSIINTLLYVGGILAVIMIVFGGFRYATSGGNSSSVTAAKNTIVYAVIGLIIIILAYAIVNFVITSI